MAPLFEHIYEPLTKDDESSDDLIPNPVKSKWMNYHIQLSIPALIALFVTQLLITALIYYMIHLNKSLVLPLDSYFRNSLGNYCLSSNSPTHRARFSTANHLEQILQLQLSNTKPESFSTTAHSSPPPGCQTHIQAPHGLSSKNLPMALSNFLNLTMSLTSIIYTKR